MLEIQWRYVVLALVILCPLSWTMFAVTYYVIALINGDFDSDDRMMKQAVMLDETLKEGLASSVNRTNNEPCVQNVNGFLSMLLFSIESQETIGYGYRWVRMFFSIVCSLLCCRAFIFCRLNLLIILNQNLPIRDENDYYFCKILLSYSVFTRFSMKSTCNQQSIIW